MPSPYKPVKITGNHTGLVQSREEFELPEDAYPVLQNAYVWRERILRKKGVALLGRLRRVFTNVSLGNSSASPWIFSVLNPLAVAGTITNATQANPGQITSPNHGLNTGQKIVINGVVGMTQLNGNQYTITFVDANNFTLGVDTTGFSPYISGGYWKLTSEPNSEIQPGSVKITIAAGPDIVFTDQGNGTLTSPTAMNSGVINYITSVVTLTTTAIAGTATTISFNYYPSLPVMGLRDRELPNSSFPQTVAFDTKYAYRYTSAGWQEFIPGTTWTGNDSNFFWTTNYWTNNSNLKLFWETNFSGTSGDPIRYTDGVTWTNFAPQLDASANLLNQCLALLPFRSRLLAFNTLEGTALNTSVSYPQRVRWSALGSPLPAQNPNSWRQDIPGQGNFLDIPTSDNITAVGFVRDNLVIYCEKSTWQLRYTGRSIAPFQIERVNSELGAESLFSAIQFDTSLVGIGDKGIVECDSFSSKRIDIKILDLVFNFNNVNSGPTRIQGIRDFRNKIAYWTYPYDPEDGSEVDLTYPNRRLLYNYENDSWAIFEDSFTALGNFRPPSGRTWLNANISSPPSSPSWEKALFSWADDPELVPDIIGGNQQGYVVYLDKNATNDVSLFIQNITGNTSDPTVITSPNHNLATGQIIAIKNMPIGTAFANSLNYPQQGFITAATQANPCQITSASHNLTTGSVIEIGGVGGMVQLNGNLYTVTVVDTNNFTLNVDSTLFTAYTSGGTWTNKAVRAFYVNYIDANNFSLHKFNPASGNFDIPQLDPPATYIGGGEIAVRDNFIIQSKKFGFLDEGQNVQLGYADILMAQTASGAISMNILYNYNESNPINILPLNGDQFFNQIVPTTNPEPQNIAGTKYWHHVFCPVHGNFITIQYTLSNAQMAGLEQEQDVQIDAQVLWMRAAGRLRNI